MVSVVIYIGKLKRRVKSLLLPYIIWNLLAMAIVLLKSSMPSLFPSLAKENHDLSCFVNAFWSSQDGNCPILYPLWYVRDLIVVVILSPLVYILVKNFREWALVLFFILWYFPLVDFPPGFSMTSFFFFGVAAFITIAYMLEDRKKIKLRKEYPESTFFIFCFHALILGDVSKVLIKVCHANGPSLMVLVYVSTFLLVLAISFYTWLFMKRYLLGVLQLINGSR